MKYITGVVRKLLPKESSIKPLGRWRLENCDKKINYKIDMSNEDHCGPCGQYMLSQLETKDVRKNAEKEGS